MIIYNVLAPMSLEASGGTWRQWEEKDDFSWEDDDTLPQNSFKPFLDLAEASLQMNTILVLIYNEVHRDRQTFCSFYKDICMIYFEITL